MGEFFEITFFKERASDIQKDREALSNLMQIEPEKNVFTQHKFPLFEHRTVVFEIFNECAFVEYQISLENLVFRKETYQELLKALLELVSSCFNIIPDIAFATGIYELTYYYSEHAKSLQDVVEQLLPRCPFLFLRTDDPALYPKAIPYNNILLVQQEGALVQKIF